MMTDKEFSDLIDSVCKEYKGDGGNLSNAIGSITMGRLYGWRAMSIIQSEPTIRKYQDILGVKYKDVLPDRGLYAHRSLGLKIADKFNSFWAVVQNRGSGKLPRNEKVLLQ